MHLYRLDLATAEVKRLTEAEGSHAIDFSADKQFYLDTHSDFLSMPATSLYRNDGSLIRKLDVSSDDSFDYVQIAEPKLIEIPTDNQPMDGMLILPPDFDKSKKYPLLVHMYAAHRLLESKNDSEDSGTCGTGCWLNNCLLYTSPSPRDATLSRMPSSA